jgi:redox-sensitive bicupin YhaK (pirin superfamily)
MSVRPVKSTRLATPAVDGAGVKLHRAFGFHDPEMFDPFLLFDEFGGDTPDDYAAGFPWHPHRGIETVTYVLDGSVEHGDSLGNSGVLGAGGLQWMTAGSGILHQEMPRGNAAGRMHGFQLWGNLPSTQKMTAPRYQDFSASDIPETGDDDGTLIKVVAGAFRGVHGPVDGVAARPLYLDIHIPPGRQKSFDIDTRRNSFAYIFQGSARFGDAARPRGVLVEKEHMGQELNLRDLSGNRTLVELGAGDAVVVRAGPDGVRFLLVSGAPIGEPVAWHGPIVMNTKDEIRQAISDLRNDTFIRAEH